MFLLTSLIFSLPSQAIYANIGDTVEIAADVSENSGVQSWVMTVQYDSAELELLSVEPALFKSVLFDDDPAAGTATLNFYSSADISGDGSAFLLRFRVKDGFDGCTVTLTPSDDPDECFNTADENVPCTVSTDTITLLPAAASAPDKTESAAESLADEPESSSETSEGGESKTVTAAKAEDTSSIQTAGDSTNSARELSSPEAAAEAAAESSADTSEQTETKVPADGTLPVRSTTQTEAPQTSETPQQAAVSHPETQPVQNSPETGAARQLAACGFSALFAAAAVTVCRRK